MIKMSEKITYTKIKTLFKKTDKTKTEIDKWIKEKEADIRSKRKDFSDEDVMNNLYRTTFSHLQRIITDVGGTELYLYVICANESNDWIKSKVRQIEQVIKDEGIEFAIANSYVDVTDWTPDGLPKNKVYKWFWDQGSSGNDVSKRVGEVLPDESWIRTIIGIASKDGKIFKRFDLTISGDFADPGSEYFKKIYAKKMIVSNVTIKKELKDRYILNARASSFFSNLADGFEDFSLDSKVIEITFKNYIQPLKTIENKFEKMTLIENEHNRKSYDLCVSKCIVVGMEPATSTSSARLFVNSLDRGLFDDDGNPWEPFTVWWRNHIPLDFGVDSEIYLFYSISQSETKNDREYTGEWNQITFNASGVIVTELVERETKPIKNDEIASTEQYIPELEELTETTNIELDDDDIKNLIADPESDNLI